MLINLLANYRERKDKVEKIIPTRVADSVTR